MTLSGNSGEDGHSHILMFTQFRDTQKWLTEYLRGTGHHVTELYGQDHVEGDRGERLAAFRKENQGILLCTETASESLNLQFCTALVNHDIPWNPMTLEQRAGRIDRIGQERPVVDVVNLFYENTAEHDAYKAVERRFKDIVDNVGAYPPIIAANIQAIIRDGKDPDAELDKIESRNGLRHQPAEHHVGHRERSTQPTDHDGRFGEVTEGPRPITGRVDGGQHRWNALGGNRP